MTKTERACKAASHHRLMTEIFADEDFENYIYDGNNDIIWHTMYKRQKPINIVITENDTITEIINNWDQKAVCALNFASFTSPGGGFMTGALAQEESLCHSSNLYEFLISDLSYYNTNKQYYINDGAYADRAIVSRDVVITKETVVKVCDIITCAAPNKSVLRTTSKPWDNDVALSKRIAFMLNVAESENEDVLILGAWGCGVFQQNPYEVALMFKNALSNPYLSFSKVIFAIPPGKNHNAFKQVFNDCTTI